MTMCSAFLGGEIALDPQAFGTAFEALRAGALPRNTADGQPISCNGRLGSSGGGTKLVYDAVLEGAAIALALPNTADVAEKVWEEWRMALAEPAATTALRGLGLLVNTRSEIVNVELGGEALPAIAMTRYQDLPWQIRDSKNPSSSTGTADIFTDNTLDIDGFIAACEPLTSDAALLIANGINLQKDCFNLAVRPDGTVQLYFNDLGSAEQLTVAEQASLRSELGRFYGKHLVGAVLNGITHAEYDRHKQLFQGRDFAFNGQIDGDITARILAKI